jgi:hypothetical protein
MKAIDKRLSALERTRRTNADTGAYIVDIGDGFVTWQGQRLPLDEWQRRYPDAVVVDIGGTRDDAVPQNNCI